MMFNKKIMVSRSVWISSLGIQSVLLCLLCTLMFSCQSDKKLIDINNIDSKLQPSFSTCVSGGGTNDTQVYKKEKLYGSFDTEWLVKGGDWKIVVMSSIGQDLMSVDYGKKDNKILISGIQSFPYNIKAGEGGYLYVQGKMTPIKVSEIPCILNHKYPKSWLKSALAYKRGNSYFINKKESKRQIEMELLVKRESTQNKSNVKSIKKEDKIYICATVSWDVFLWFDAELKICTEDNKSSLIDVRDYLVKLTSIDS